VLLVDGAKLPCEMKKRKNFFQVFSFSFILQGKIEYKKWQFIRQ